MTRPRIPPEKLAAVQELGRSEMCLRAIAAATGVSRVSVSVILRRTGVRERDASQPFHHRLKPRKYKPVALLPIAHSDFIKPLSRQQLMAGRA